MEDEDWGTIDEDAVKEFAGYVSELAIDDDRQPKNPVKYVKNTVFAKGDTFFERMAEDKEANGAICQDKIELFFPEAEIDRDDYDNYLSDMMSAAEVLIKVMNELSSADPLTVCNYTYAIFPEKLPDGFKLWIGITMPCDEFEKRGFLDMVTVTPLNIDRWEKECQRLRASIARKITTKEQWEDLPNGIDGKKIDSVTKGVRLWHVVTRTEEKDQLGFCANIEVTQLVRFVPAIVNEVGDGSSMMLFDDDSAEKYAWFREISTNLAYYMHWYFGYGIPSSKIRICGWGDDTGFWIVATKKKDIKKT